VKKQESETLAKLIKAMRSRTICWQDHRKTYWS